MRKRTLGLECCALDSHADRGSWVADDGDVGAGVGWCVKWTCLLSLPPGDSIIKHHWYNPTTFRTS